jgi:hypothetical protein
MNDTIIQKKCHICGGTFKDKRNNVVNCETCRWKEIHYNMLTVEDRKLINKWRNSTIVKDWVNRNRDKTVQETKTWKCNHYPIHKEIKRTYHKKVQNITLRTAYNNHSEWTDDDMDFLVENAQNLTANEIAIRLGRTHDSIITRASNYKIKLQTPEKLHGKLKTKNNS